MLSASAMKKITSAALNNVLPLLKKPKEAFLSFAATFAIVGSFEEARPFGRFVAAFPAVRSLIPSACARSLSIEKS